MVGHIIGTKMSRKEDNKMLMNYLEECTVCYELLRDPRTLPCGHTLRGKCAEQNTKAPSANQPGELIVALQLMLFQLHMVTTTGIWWREEWRIGRAKCHVKSICTLVSYCNSRIG